MNSDELLNYIAICLLLFIILNSANVRIYYLFIYFPYNSWTILVQKHLLLALKMLLHRLFTFFSDINSLFLKSAYYVLSFHKIEAGSKREAFPPFFPRLAFVVKCILLVIAAANFEFSFGFNSRSRQTI